MQEVKNLDFGPKWYRVVLGSVVKLHKAPSTKKETVNGLVLGHNEVFVSNLRCRIGSSDFVFLADGRGWIYKYSSAGNTNKCTTSVENAQEVQLRFQHPVVEECDR